MLLIPQRLFPLPFVESLLYDGESCILTKKLDQPALNRQSYISTLVLSYVQRGVQQIKNYDGEVINVSSGQLIVLPKGIYTISDLIPEDNAFETVLFFIHDQLIDDFLSQLNWTPRRDATSKKSYLHLEAFELLPSYTKSLRQLYAKRSFKSEAILKLKLLELLHLFAQSESGMDFVKFLVDTRTGQFRNLQKFMESNFDKPLKVEDYAYMTGRSLSSFRRDFRQHFDNTPQQWLKEKRMEKALQLLTKATENVTQIAYEVGYENISHFIKEFKKKYHLTPKQFILKERERTMKGMK